MHTHLDLSLNAMDFLYYVENEEQNGIHKGRNWRENVTTRTPTEEHAY